MTQFYFSSHFIISSNKKHTWDFCPNRRPQIQSKLTPSLTADEPWPAHSHLPVPVLDRPCLSALPLCHPSSARGCTDNTPRGQGQQLGWILLRVCSVWGGKMKRLLTEVWLSALLMWAIWAERMGAGTVEESLSWYRKSVLTQGSAKLFTCMWIPHRTEELEQSCTFLWSRLLQMRAPLLCWMENYKEQLHMQ